MSGGGQAATAEHTVVAAPTAASVAAPPLASAHGVKTTVTAATVASGGACGLTLYKAPLYTKSGGVGERSERVSRVLQRLCGCSWASVQKLLRLKEAFVVPHER
ncbi:RNA pseudouridylate synthase domain-containing protein, putative [Eimeria acervulina]|uniref:RNA pseudouridylate synthase domain-containing protein, putative n=1 Tax=Eimeria acervulina TaxID=5801 RepID=U6GHB2_EIMAC|nr:RNA pseudouridylate synthase domain-containing protein, putative [Eimeria acervulina]CDI78668.1 RNA pseudouridylate synthase domain-containing protein, putative [Eimeria acervulina]